MTGGGDITDITSLRAVCCDGRGDISDITSLRAVTGSD